MDKKKRAFSESCSGKGGFFLMADVIGDNETPGPDAPLPTLEFFCKYI